MVRLFNLRNVRLMQFLTQAELAAKAGVSRQTVVAAEQGNLVHIPTARRLATALGVEPHALLEDR